MSAIRDGYTVIGIASSDKELQIAYRKSQTIRQQNLVANQQLLRVLRWQQRTKLKLVECPDTGR